MHAEVSEDLTPSQVRPPLNPNLVKVQKKIEKQAPNEVNIVPLTFTTPAGVIFRIV